MRLSGRVLELAWQLPSFSRDFPGFGIENPGKYSSCRHKWNIWPLSPHYPFLQPISWNTDKVVSHLGHGEEGKCWEWQKELGLYQFHAAQLPHQLRLLCERQISFSLVKGLYYFLSSSSNPLSPVSFTIFGYHDDFALFLDSGNICLYHTFDN